MSARREWDAATYRRISGPQQAWAREQFERIGPLRGDEVILDAGCGSGNITAQLAAMVPRGRVYGVDASAEMAEHARAELGDRATVLCQDLLELELPEQVDLVFSNATFHWIEDHRRLFARFHAVLRPDGRIVAQCGGRGNIDAFRAVAEAVASESPYRLDLRPWHYATAEDTAQLLATAGFTEIRTWLEPRPTTLQEPREFLRTVCLLPYLERLAEEQREPFIEAVTARLPDPVVLDYVRLNITAKKPDTHG